MSQSRISPTLMVYSLIVPIKMAIFLILVAWYPRVVSTIFVVTYISQIPEATFFTLRPFGPGLFFPAGCELLRKWVLVRTHPLLFQAGEVSWQLRSMCWTEQNGPNKTNITAVFAATFSEILCIVLLPQISKADVGGQAAQLWCRSLFQRKMGQI